MALIWLLIPVWLCWGSFLNVLAYRLVREQNIATPRSRCPLCHHQLAWYDNIPVISWILLQGRCLYCHKPISMLYPFMELLTALVMSLLCFFVPFVYIPAYFIFFSALLVTFRSDIETMLISQFMTLFLIPIGLLCSYFNFLPISFLQSILGALFGYLFLWSIAHLFLLITGKKGMGEGDFELLALIGAFLGFSGTWYTLLLGSLLGAFFGIGLILFSDAKCNTKIPFGPFLAAAGIVVGLYPFIAHYLYSNFIA